MTPPPAPYLGRRADAFDGEAREHVEAAARRYERIAELLAPAMDWDGPRHYRHFIGDLEKQRAHADVLRRVRAELAAATDDMAAALAAEGVELTPTAG